MKENTKKIIIILILFLIIGMIGLLYLKKSENRNASNVKKEASNSEKKEKEANEEITEDKLLIEEEEEELPIEEEELPIEEKEEQGLMTNKKTEESKKIEEQNKPSSKKDAAVMPDSVTIIDETKNCAQAMEAFYEDENYIYYFTCIKSGNVYVSKNGTKQLLKTALNNGTVTMQELEEAGYTFTKKAKEKK